MAHRIKAVAFDVIGTVFSLESLRPKLVEQGLASSTLEGWFAAACRDAFALACTDAFEPFLKVLDGALEQVAAEQGRRLGPAERKAVLAGMSELDAYPDAADALERLHDHDVGVMALSNGDKASTEHLLKRAGLDRLVAEVVTVEEVKLAKPRAEVYERAAKRAHLHRGELMLVAAHPWDVHGAKAARLQAAYVARGVPYPSVLRTPDLEGESLAAVAAEIVDRVT